MARIAGVNIPTKKRVEIGLTYIFGIGPTSAKHICTECGIPDSRRVADMTEDELSRVREMIDRDYIVEGEKRSEISRHIKRKMDISCYVGLRHRKGLPVRGQRTKTNARTRKGPAIAIAGKKMNTK